MEHERLRQKRSGHAATLILGLEEAAVMEQKLKEATAVHNQAVARKQEFPIKKLLLGFIAFAAASTLLYLYLGYIAAEDEEEV